MAYVVPDQVLEAIYDVLVEHDLMQRYDIRVMPRRRDLAVSRASPGMGLRAR